MSEPTYIACPRCGERSAMTAMQKRLFHGRTLTCQRCAKPFRVTEETPDPVPAPAVVEPQQLGAATQSFDPPMPARDEPPVPSTPQGIRPAQLALLLGAVAAMLIIGLYLVVAPSVHRSRERARQFACVSNLRQIGIAIQMYVAGNGGAYPDSLDMLVKNASLPADLLTCPATEKTPYVYVGKGLVNPAPNWVVVYEPLANHPQAGINALYADGSVQLLTPAVAVQVLPQLAPGATTAPSTSQPTSP